MDVAIAGGHGQVALHLSRMLTRRGDTVRGIIRSEVQAGDLDDVGATPVVLNIEESDSGALAEVVRGADAAVFAAGAGPGSGAQRKQTVDYEGAVKLLEAARRSGIGRYVIISSMGTDDPPDGDDVFAVYLRAKARADQAVMDSELAWTVVRPGGLTNAPATGKVRLGRHVRRGRIPREDVAAVILAVLDDQRTAGHIFEVVSGDTPIGDALAALVR